MEQAVSLNAVLGFPAKSHTHNVILAIAAELAQFPFPNMFLTQHCGDSSILKREELGSLIALIQMRKIKDVKQEEVQNDSCCFVKLTLL